MHSGVRFQKVLLTIGRVNQLLLGPGLLGKQQCQVVYRMLVGLFGVVVLQIAHVLLLQDVEPLLVDLKVVQIVQHLLEQNVLLVAVAAN